MVLTSTLAAQKTASLDSLYALIGHDLKRVDALILERVKNEVPLIGDIAHHIVASGGKRIRPALTLATSRLCRYENGNHHIPVAAAIEFIHTATLLHDDVVDDSKLRRGLATANEIFGNKASVLVGDFLLSQAFQMTVKEGNLRVLEVLADASSIISKGEVMQLMTERDPETIVADYLYVISSKTAALFAAACELGGIVAENKEAAGKLREFGQHLGIAFQLTDDVLDYSADQEKLGKTVGDDFREGKITLPVILAYQAGTEDECAFWQRTVRDLQQTPDDLDIARELLHKYNAVKQTINMAAEYCHKARLILNSFPTTPAKAALLDTVDFALSRAY